MRFSTVSAFGIWNFTPRTLSGFGPLMTISTLVNQTIATSSNVTITANANQVMNLTIAANFAAAGGTINLNDGTQSYLLGSVASALTIAIQHVAISTGISLVIANSSGVASIKWAATEWVWVQ